MYNQLRKARYLGSMKPFSEGEPGSLGSENSQSQKEMNHLPTVNFQVLLLLVSGRVMSPDEQIHIKFCLI